MYFGREWQSLVEASFRNFLAEAIQQLPLPALLRFDSDRRMRVDLQKRVAALSLDNSRLTKRLAAAQQRPLPVPVVPPEVLPVPSPQGDLDGMCLAPTMRGSC